MSELGAVIYRGPSLLTGDPIVAIATGLDGGSKNPKTGAMVQVWVLRPDVAPMDAKRQNLDDAICGDCRHRGDHGHASTCYVVAWLGPYNVYRRFRENDYVDVTWPELQAVIEGRHVRLGAYGDPGAVPFEIWRTLLATAAGWVGYTHTWRICDPRFKSILMASVDTVDEFHVAHLAGWRTFRVRGREEDLVRLVPAPGSWPVQSIPLEFTCPASDEAGHRTTCQRCQLCRGTSSPARSVAIVAHGNDGVMANFYRDRAEAVA